LPTNKKPTGHLLLAVGFDSCLNFIYLAQQVPSPRRHLIRMDVLVVVHTVIRVVWVIESIISNAPALIFELFGRLRALVGVTALEKLDQPFDQSLLSADHVQPALVPVIV
jgi:hypothetical protein